MGLHRFLVSNPVFCESHDARIKNTARSGEQSGVFGFQNEPWGD